MEISFNIKKDELKTHPFKLSFTYKWYFILKNEVINIAVCQKIIMQHFPTP